MSISALTSARNDSNESNEHRANRANREQDNDEHEHTTDNCKHSHGTTQFKPMASIFKQSFLEDQRQVQQNKLMKLQQRKNSRINIEALKTARMMQRDIHAFEQRLETSTYLKNPL